MMWAAVRFDRTDRDEEHRGDLLVRIAERQQDEDVALPFRDRLGERGGVRDDEIAAKPWTGGSRS